MDVVPYGHGLFYIVAVACPNRLHAQKNGPVTEPFSIANCLLVLEDVAEGEDGDRKSVV